MKHNHHIAILLSCVALAIGGCSEYEQEQMKEAADHVGNASKSAADRARASTADGLQDLSDDIRPDEATPADKDEDQ